MNSDQKTEQAIVQAGADKAPRVTPADIEAAIIREHYLNAAEAILSTDSAVCVVHGERPDDDEPLARLTFCMLTLRNGFTVTGESACASPENFNAEIGRRIARENAVAKIWPLMGYALREQLTHGAWIHGTLEHTD